MQAIKSAVVVATLNTARQEFAKKLEAYYDALRTYHVQKPLEEVCAHTLPPSGFLPSRVPFAVQV